MIVQTLDSTKYLRFCVSQKTSLVLYIALVKTSMKQTHSLQYKLPLLPTSILKLFLKRMWIGHLLRHAPSCFWDSLSSPHTFTPSLIVHVQCCGCRELCRVFFGWWVWWWKIWQKCHLKQSSSIDFLMSIPLQIGLLNCF